MRTLKRQMGLIAIGATTLIPPAAVWLAVLFLFGASSNAAPPKMLVDGQPFFPLGWFTNERPSNAADVAPLVADMKSQGMNSVMQYYTAYFTPETGHNYIHAQQWLEDLGSQGMKFMLHLPRNAENDAPVFVSGDYAYFDQVINQYKDHPALLGWYLEDEPPDWPAETVQGYVGLYNRVKTLDPSHPVFVTHHVYARTADTYFAAGDGTDVLITDLYPVHAPRSGDPGGQLWRQAAEAKHYAQLAASHNKPYMNVVQAFFEGAYYQQPTYAEFRYLAYAPVVEGARGLFPYFYYNDPTGYYGTTPDQRANVVGPIIREIGSLTGAIMSDSTAVTITSNRDTDTFGHGIEDVTYLIGQDANGKYDLIAVNNTAYALSVTFSLSGDSLASLLGSHDVNIPVLFEGRDVLLQRGAGSEWTITDNFGPYDVHVYFIPEPGTLALLATGLLGVLVYAWRKRR